MRQPDINMQIFENEGMVVLGFSKKVEEISMPPEVARGVAEEIARKAFQGSFGQYPQQSNMLLEQKRTKLLKRVELILNNLDSRKISRNKIAAQVIDTVLSEIL